MSLKPIQIIKVPGGYHVTVNDVPVVKAIGGGIGLDRVKAGIGKKNPPKQKLEDDAAPFRFTAAGDAVSIAHQIGNYMMKLGDFVDTYTGLVGIDNPEKFWHRTLG